MEDYSRRLAGIKTTAERIVEKDQLTPQISKRYTKLTLEIGDQYVINPDVVQWAKSKGECWLEIFSKPGWTKEDHIPVKI